MQLSRCNLQAQGTKEFEVNTFSCNRIKFVIGGMQKKVAFFSRHRGLALFEAHYCINCMVRDLNTCGYMSKCMQGSSIRKAGNEPFHIDW